MCHNAWQRPMHVGHMPSHVCDTWCMTLLEAIYTGVPIQFVEGSKKKREEGKREKGGKKKEKGRRKEEKRKEEKRRKKRKKEKEKRERKEGKEGVLRSEQTRMVNNLELRYKR